MERHWVSPLVLDALLLDDSNFLYVIRSTCCLKYHEMIRPKLYKNLVRVVSTLDQVVSTPCSKHKIKSCKTGQVVSTLVQVVSTQCIQYKAKRSSSVDTSPGSVDTRDSSQNTFWPSWDSVPTLAQVVSTLEAFPEPLLGCFGIVCRH
ncbi:hypothetical protein Taro_008865 [Colocasia esculenta]|uniref:Uncharacterized protein n=1 Tax=Colocasia esculenta TaxID=4460 RepID=A0A843U3G0_COLES|nr:hypothetical protein [Colocasia esculenta]